MISEENRCVFAIREASRTRKPIYEPRFTLSTLFLCVVVVCAPPIRGIRPRRADDSTFDRR